MIFETSYVSSNCNPTPTVADWGKNGLICYGSCNSVLIYDPKLGSGGKVTKTLVSHTKRVNSLKWLSGIDTEFETELISGSTDGTAVVWTLNNDKFTPFLLKGHESNVNIVDGLYKQKEKCQTIIVTASMDCTVKIWIRDKPTDAFLLNQTVNFNYSITVGLKLCFLTEDNDLILACALDNSKINLYVENDNKFESSTVLVGHEDWIRGLDFTIDNKGDLLLASCAQDTFIRLWRITKQGNSDKNKSERLQIKSKNHTYNVYLESVLAGHEGWVYSVNWSPKNLQLLSASIDKSMIIWEYDETSGLWLEKIRVGEVGGNTLGFYGGIFGANGDQILAYSYHGAFHIWSVAESGNWEPTVTVGGHFSDAVDLSWEPSGQFLYSVSADQTTRIHAPWPNEKHPITWHEIARPQVHGYDLSSLAVISRYRFASGAEEKVIRVFEAPKTFVDNFRRICGVQDDIEGDSIISAKQMVPKGASVPSLGLSNKAVFTDDNIDDLTPVDNKNPYPEESHFSAQVMTEPPTEETLLQNTLWPEVQKLYGHGYEIFSLAASPDGKYLASASKSTKPEYAAILIWDTTTWKQTQKLMSHTLTVVQMRFSPDSKHLLSVSRDRRWSLFTKNQQNAYELAATTDKKSSIHSRIIWTCDWSHDSKYFATGSRDGKVVIWTINDEKQANTSLGKCEATSRPLEFKNDAVTALAFAPALVNGAYLVAVGFESGLVQIFTWNTKEWREVLLLDKSDAHHLTVKKLAFRPIFGRAGVNMKEENVLQLASCSSDSSVRIFDIFIDKLK